MTHLDLCSGIGGFHIAAEWAGFETIGFSEIEPYCCALLAQHWPEIKNYGDLRRADFSGLRGRVTILSAGVPCQPASLAGKRRGKDDDRWLWSAVFDVTEQVEPAWLLLENPPGILSLGEFGGVLLRLGSFGYEVRLFSVPANAVGAKHLRYRVFIVCHAAGIRCGERQSGASETLWDQARRQEPDGRSNDAEVVAHAELFDCDGRRPGWREAAGIRSCDATQRSGVESEALADAGSAGMRQSAGACQDASEDGQKYNHKFDCGGEPLADANRARLEEHESRESGQCASVIGSGWPHRFGFTQPPLCRRVDGIPNRSHRLKALGNAVVPQQAYPFFEAIMKTELRKAAGK